MADHETNQTEPVLIQTMPELEILCEKCQGRGWYSFGGGEREACPMCDGAGYAPTVFGEKVLTLMRHNLKPILQQIMK